MGEVAERVAAIFEGEDVTGVPFGFEEFDKRVGGFQKKRLYIVAGRPGMGKSAFVTQGAANAALADYRVYLSSLEMGNEETAERIVSLLSHVPAAKLQRGGLCESELRRMLEAGHRMQGKHLWLDDSPGLSVADIRARARRVQQRAGLDIVIVDHLGLIRPEGRAENRTQALGQISGDLKVMAKDLDVPVVALAQLNRDVEKRGATYESKMPQITDLRESGRIEEDADGIVFLVREDYYDADTPRKGVADLAIPKLRGRRPADYGELTLGWDGPTMRFIDRPAEPQADRWAP